MKTNFVLDFWHLHILQRQCLLAYWHKNGNIWFLPLIYFRGTYETKQHLLYWRQRATS